MNIPDIELFHTAAMLVRKFAPITCWSIRWAWITRRDVTEQSSEYRNHAIQQDTWLAPLIVEWLEQGYDILVTGDHGINADQPMAAPPRMCVRCRSS